jgi:protoporphyrinogen oxidase
VQRASDALTFRNTILVYLHIDAERLFDDQWIYLHSNELLLGRVTNFRNWATELCRGQRTTILAGEFWCNASDALWSEADESLIARAQRELRSTGLLGDARLLAGHVVRIPRCYPVYARGYRQHVQRVVEYLRNFGNLTPIGRYGAFKYNNQDHSILMGILAAENLLASQTHDLWSINSDYDPHEEAALITETGLTAQNSSG